MEIELDLDCVCVGHSTRVGLIALIQIVFPFDGEKKWVVEETIT